MTKKTILEKLNRATPAELKPDIITLLIQDAVNEANDRCDIINALHALAREFTATADLIESETFWGEDSEIIEPDKPEPFPPAYRAGF